MARNNSVTIKILGDASSARRAFGQAEHAAGGFGSKMAGFGKTVAIGLGAAAVGAGALAKSFVDAAVESQKVTRQTEAVIKSMGGASNVTAKQVSDLSTKLSMQSGVDDELIQGGQNVLLTFGKVRNEVGKGNKIFDRATQSALDMSVALGTDLNSANIQLGKALNDPVKGVTALTKAGVSFTAQQKDQIKAMVASGDTLGAQKIILSEMEKQFGGSAAAQATAGEKLKVIWGNLQEQLGGKLLPIVEKVATFLAKNMPAALAAVGRVVGPVAKGLGSLFKTLSTGMTEEDYATGFERVALVIRDVVLNKLIPAFKAVAGFVTGTLLPSLGRLFKFLADHRPILIGVAVAIGVGLVNAFIGWAVAAGTAAVATLAAMAPVILIGAAIAALVAGVIWAYQNWGFFRTAVDKVASFMRNTLWPALQAVASWIVGTLVPTIGRVISKFGEWIGKAVEVGSRIRETIGGIVSFVAGMPGKIAAAAAGMFDGIKNAFRSAINWILRKWNGLSFTIPGVSVPGLGKVGGTKIEVPQVPYLAHGGIVTQPTLAMIGEAGPEAVIPLNRAGGMGTVNVTINMPPGSDGQDVVDAITRWERRNGKLYARA